MSIFCVDSNIPKLNEFLQLNDNIIYTFDNGEITNKELRDKNCEYLIVRSTIKVDEQLLADTNVKFVASATSGTEHIDKYYLKKNNIDFFAALGANSNSVAEYVIFSILLYTNQQKKNINDISKLQIGIVGYGNIGTKVANYLQQMNIKFKICDPLVANNHKNVTFYSLDNIISTCNIITTHVPLTKNGTEPTFNLLNDKRIDNIKDDSLVINCSRGDIWDEYALLQNSDRLSIIIDTWIGEPTIVNRQLFNKILLATPHIAGHSTNGKLNATLMIAKELYRILKFNNSASFLPIHNMYKIHKYDDAMTNYKKLFDTLLKFRNLLETSNEMKQNIYLNDNDFVNYFKSTRTNYVENWEVLYYNQ